MEGPHGVRRAPINSIHQIHMGSVSIWVRISREGEETFESLTRPHIDALWRTAFRMTGHRDDADDLTQAACLKAYRSFPQFEPGSNYRAWIFRILTNLCLDHLRRQARCTCRYAGSDEEKNGARDRPTNRVPDLPRRRRGPPDFPGENAGNREAALFGDNGACSRHTRPFARLVHRDARTHSIPW